MGLGINRYYEYMSLKNIRSFPTMSSFDMSTTMDLINDLLPLIVTIAILSMIFRMFDKLGKMAG